MSFFPPVKGAHSAGGSIPTPPRTHAPPASTPYRHPHHRGSPMGANNTADTHTPVRTTFTGISLAPLSPSPKATRATGANIRYKKGRGPNKPGAATDFSPAHHHAATQIARLYRGVYVRRKVRAQQITRAYHNRKAVIIQSLVRRVRAKRLFAALDAAREAHREAVRQQHMDQLVRDIGFAASWQMAAYDGASRVLQHHIRRFLAFRHGERSQNGGTCGRLFEPTAPATSTPAFRIAPEKVRAINAQNKAVEDGKHAAVEVGVVRIMRRKRRLERALSELDFEYLAEVVQLRWRVFVARREMHNRRYRKEYCDRYASVIQRARRCYCSRGVLQALRRAKEEERAARTLAHEAATVDQLKVEVAWRPSTMHEAATKVQRAYRARLEHRIMSTSWGAVLVGILSLLKFAACVQK